MEGAGSGPQVMLRSKEVGNPVDFFNKTFAEYQEGFAANGELLQKGLNAFIFLR